jgi:ribosomal protein S18 acetylase RimI-like enzyme
MAFFYEYEDHHKEFFKIDCLSENDIVDFFSRSVGSPESATFIAVEDGMAVGYITVSIRVQPSFYKFNKVGAISGLMVQKDSRRKGIGTQLLAAATGFFHEKGVKYYTVYTSVNNHSAITLYERNGMIPLYTTLIGELDTTFAEVEGSIGL